MISDEIKYLLEEHSDELRNLPKDKIEKALNSNGIDATNELVDFEYNFGGLKLIIANHEFQFGLLWGGGFPFWRKSSEGSLVTNLIHNRSW